MKSPQESTTRIRDAAPLCNSPLEIPARHQIPPLTEDSTPRSAVKIPAKNIEDTPSTSNATSPAKPLTSGQRQSLHEDADRAIETFLKCKPGLRTRPIYNALRVKSLLSNRYLGDCWPTKSHPSHPCHCLSVTTKKITDAAISAALAHYTRMLTLSGPLPDTKQPEIEVWKKDLIISRIRQAQKFAMNDIQNSTGLVMHNDIHHGGGLRDRARTVVHDYSGHVQPWMDGLIHRELIKAAITAFQEIDERNGTTYATNSQGPLFFFKRPGTDFSNPFMTRYPCLCKNTAANDIADSVLTNAVNSVTNLSSMSPAGQESIETRLATCIGRATVAILEEIAEADDFIHRCSAHGASPHMHPWMRMKVQSCCSEAASKGLQMIEKDFQSMKNLGTKTRAKHEEEHESMPSLREQIMPILPFQAHVRGTQTWNAATPGVPSIPNTQAQRETDKRIYAKKLSEAVFSITLQRLKNTTPAEHYKAAAPRLTTALTPPIAAARDSALKIIARYESIADSAGNIDRARNLPLQEHGWKDSILIYAITTAAKRAGENLRDELEAAKVHHEGQRLHNKTSGELAAGRALLDLAERPIPRITDVE